MTDLKIGMIRKPLDGVSYHTPLMIADLTPGTLGIVYACDWDSTAVRFIERLLPGQDLAAAILSSDAWVIDSSYVEILDEKGFLIRS